MLAKPSTCLGCPLYGDGQGFVPDEIREVDVLILGQNPGAEEEASGTPFVGKSGQMLMEKLLPRAGLTRDQVSLGNVLKCRLLEPVRNGPRVVDGKRYKATNTLPKGKVLNQAMAHCMAQHFTVPPALLASERPLIVAQGALALRALTGVTNPTTWRGYLSPVPYVVA